MANGRKGDVANGDGANATKWLNRIAQGFFSPQIGGARLPKDRRGLAGA